MGRTIATLWHASFALIAGVLYFFFVLPRWPELMGDTTHGLGTAARIGTGVVIALAALPVVFTLLRTRKPEYGTPLLALRLRTWSVVAHVLAGVVIVGTAVSEIWLSLDAVGQWLFGIYGAAAAIALLGIFGFYLSFVAELPPPPPKPLKPKKPRRTRRKKSEETVDESEQDSETEATTGEAEATTGATEATTGEAEPTGEETEADADDVPEGEEAVEAAASRGGLRNRRPSGKSARRRRRSRGGVAVDDN